MRMRRRDHVRPRVMHARVNRKRRSVQRMLALHHFAFSVHQHQIRNANLAEVHAKRIHPEMIRAIRIARRDVPGNAFVETKFREQAKRSRQPLFAMPAFLFNAGELGRSGKTRILYRRGSHLYLQEKENSIRAKYSTVPNPEKWNPAEQSSTAETCVAGMRTKKRLIALCFRFVSYTSAAWNSSPLP